MTFSEKLRYERGRAGLSLRDLAEMTGMAFTYISHMESGRMYPASEEKIKKLEQALELSPGELQGLAPKLNQRSVRAATEKSDEAGFVLYSVVSTLSGPEIEKIAEIIRGWQQNSR
jgi:transcriptional regulator with XRE-family HTH domain